MAEEEEYAILIPHVDAVLLLVAGGAEGGARPRSLGEEGVIAQGAWRRRKRRRETKEGKKWSGRRGRKKKRKRRRSEEEAKKTRRKGRRVGR